MKRVVVVVSLAVLLIVPFGSDVQAQSPQSPSDDQTPSSGRLLTPQQIDDLNERAETEAARLTEREAQDRRDALDDFKKGAGLGISVVIGDNDDVIDDATVVDGKVVVTRRSRDQARAALEVHQLFTANPLTANGRKAIREQIERCAQDTINCPLVGIGPFAAIQTGDSDSISSVGLGFMVGVRSDPRQDSSFNVGLGMVFDNSVKRLASGFVEGQPLPAGQTQVQFTENSSRRLMLTLSFAF
jgi:hypothetical protein